MPIKYNFKKVEAQACYLPTQKRENQVRDGKFLPPRRGDGMEIIVEAGAMLILIFSLIELFPP